MRSDAGQAKLFERLQVWRLRKLNPDLTYSELARLMGRSESTIYRHLQLHETAPKDLLQAAEHDAVAAWCQAVPIAAGKGDHRPAKDLLLHTGAIAPVTPAGTTQIALIFGSVAVPGLVSRAERDDPAGIPNVSAYLDGCVTDTGQSAGSVADTPGGGPSGGPAKQPTDFFSDPPA